MSASSPFISDLAAFFSSSSRCWYSTVQTSTAHPYTKSPNQIIIKDSFPSWFLKQNAQKVQEGTTSSWSIWHYLEWTVTYTLSQRETTMTITRIPGDRCGCRVCVSHFSSSFLSTHSEKNPELEAFIRVGGFIRVNTGAIPGCTPDVMVTLKVGQSMQVCF